MTQKYTPGPWELNMQQGYGINKGDKHIALVNYYRSKIGDKEENEANARLIAAAPDLLEALKSVREIVAAQKVLHMDAEMVRMYADKLKLIDAAIAKADGR